MSNLISTRNTVNTNFEHCSDIEEHFLTANRWLPEQIPCDGEPNRLWEPVVVLDEQAEAAYKVWQESLSYLQEDIERF